MKRHDLRPVLDWNEICHAGIERFGFRKNTMKLSRQASIGTSPRGYGGVVKFRIPPSMFLVESPAKIE
jgi:hypothetical protein